MLNDDRTAKVLLDAAGSATTVGPSNVPRAAIAGGDAKILAPLPMGLVEGTHIDRPRAIIDARLEMSIVGVPSHLDIQAHRW